MNERRTIASPADLTSVQAAENSYLIIPFLNLKMHHQISHTYSIGLRMV